MAELSFYKFIQNKKQKFKILQKKKTSIYWNIFFHILIEGSCTFWNAYFQWIQRKMKISPNREVCDFNHFIQILIFL